MEIIFAKRSYGTVINPGSYIYRPHVPTERYCLKARPVNAQNEILGLRGISGKGVPTARSVLKPTSCSALIVPLAL